MVPAPLPPPPRYDRGVHRLLPSAVAAITGEPDDVTPLPEVRAVAVLVIDGLGASLLDEHAALAPRLASARGPVLDAPFPSTTATSLTSIGTGRPPGEHGVPGYSFALADDDRPLFALTWSWERHDTRPEHDAREEVPPEAWQPLPTAFDAARAVGVRPITILPEPFLESGLTRAGLRGGDIVTANDLEETLQAVEKTLAGPGRTVVYAHHGDLDAIGHLVQPGADEWCQELARIDAAIAESVERLPSDTALLVTADHGMVAIPEDGFVELADLPELLTGVRVLTGDGRARQLFTHEGAGGEVAAAWREHCGSRAHVALREEAIAAGWFGPVVTEQVRPRIGDVVISARDLDVAWVHRDADLLGGRLPGMHGAITPEEIEVPALLLHR